MKQKNLWKKIGTWLLFMIMNISLLTACGSKEDASDTTTEDGEKVFYYGDTTFNAENDESDVNPHNGYSGWACIRYGIGETLFIYWF